MFPVQHPPYRFLSSARRAHLARILATGALVVIPVGCGTSDSSVFDSAAEATTTTAADATTITDDVATTTTQATAVDTTAATATFPAGAEMVVDFTFSPSSSGQTRNPYIAVWVEDTDGNLVQTISLWYEQSGKGARWLSDLRSWYSASGGSVTTSGATRVAGSYSVVWDGTGLDGNLVSEGSYVLFVEAAREHGPYEITSTPITIGSAGFSATLADNGELTGLSATLTV